MDSNIFNVLEKLKQDCVVFPAENPSIPSDTPVPRVFLGALRYHTTQQDIPPV